MAKPLLVNKLYPPRLRSSLMPRSRLIERLNAGLNCSRSLRPQLLAAWKGT